MSARGLLPVSILLVCSCGAAPEQELTRAAVEFTAGPLPEDTSFGAAMDLADDLLAVVAEANLLEPDPDAWTGAVSIYRRDGGGWRLEDEQDVPATWLIDPKVHIVDGRVMVVSPADGRCRDPQGDLRAQSGSVYVYEGGPEGWALTAHVCAPDHQTGFGGASTGAGDALIVESTLQYGRPPGVLARVRRVDGWVPEPVAEVASASTQSSLGADGQRLVRAEMAWPGWTVEVRPLARLGEVERRMTCPEVEERCLVGLAPGGVLIAAGSTLTRTVDDGAVDTFELAGVGRITHLVTAGRRAAVLDDAGQLFLVPLDGPLGPIAPSLGDLCGASIGAVTLTESAVAVTCSREDRGWVVPLDVD